jgi:hypothetical protein
MQATHLRQREERALLLPLDSPKRKAVKPRLFYLRDRVSPGILIPASPVARPTRY